jgi:hypothetical protein
MFNSISCLQLLALMRHILTSCCILCFAGLLQGLTAACEQLAALLTQQQQQQQQASQAQQHHTA